MEKEVKNLFTQDFLPEILDWVPPILQYPLTYGDMPGDKIAVSLEHIKKANIIFPYLLKKIADEVATNKNKIVIGVTGGSGVGKSETASIFSFYFKTLGLSSYILSGDNYPHRFPIYNDAERLCIFRKYGVLEMVQRGVCNEKNIKILQGIQALENDANEDNVKLYPWLRHYINGGIRGLKSYLGTEREICFKELNNIIDKFKKGDDEIYLKRMGRKLTELWYDRVDFSEKNILIIEWTHANNINLKGVDIPILLTSTPEETLAHRKARNRDNNVESPFIMTVLKIEQELLESRIENAKIVISKSGLLLKF